MTRPDSVDGQSLISQKVAHHVPSPLHRVGQVWVIERHAQLLVLFAANLDVVSRGGVRDFGPTRLQNLDGLRERTRVEVRDLRCDGGILAEWIGQFLVRAPWPRRKSNDQTTTSPRAEAPQPRSW